MIKLDSKAVGLALGVVAALFWLVTMSFSLLTGIGEITMTTLGSYHPFFTYSWGGMVIVVVENLIYGFVLGWTFAWVYNKFVK